MALERNRGGPVVFHNPGIARLLFEDSRFSWVWLIVRVYLGYEWLHAGYEKLRNPAWMNGGTALKGFRTRVTAVPTQGTPAITYGWYRTFLTYMLDHRWYTWFGPLVAITETVIGVMLIIGLLTEIAAFAGALMNFNYMLAGTASTNPLLFLLAVLLMMAWKTAGWLGLDRWVLPALGTPWEPGRLVRRERGAGRGRGPQPTA